MNERAVPSRASSRGALPLRGLLLPDLRVLALVLAAVLGACGGGGSSPGGPTGPQPGGTLSGRYTLQLFPSARCTTLPKGPFTFPMTMAAAGTTPYPGIQVVLEGNPSMLELEFMYTSFTLRGGMGATGDGVLAKEGPRIWVHSIGIGPVLEASDGRGEVATGTMMGYLAVGNPDDAETDLADDQICNAADSSFTLRER